MDYKIPAAEIRNMGVDIIAIGAGSVDKTQLLEMTGQRSDKIFTGYVSQILIWKASLMWASAVVCNWLMVRILMY